MSAALTSTCPVVEPTQPGVKVGWCSRVATGVFTVAGAVAGGVLGQHGVCEAFVD